MQIFLQNMTIHLRYLKTSPPLAQVSHRASGFISRPELYAKYGNLLKFVLRAMLLSVL